LRQRIFLIMTTSSYLEHYLDSLENLPGEVRRNFTLMYDLDGKNKNILQEVDGACDEYLRKVSELNPEKRQQEMKKIQKMYKEAKTYGDEKVSIAIQTYEMVDKHIRRLDADLAKFEAELREKGGRLSQTESEEDPDDDEPTKKRGRKKATQGQTKAEAAASKKKQKGGQAGRPAKDEKDKKKQKSKQKSGDGTAVGSGLSGGGGVGGLSGQVGGLMGMPQEIIDMPVDPNEPTYCVCQQVSYGEMIGCDNNDCPIEWFHFGCMQLTTKPKGKWYCPKCIVLFKKKKPFTQNAFVLS